MTSQTTINPTAITRFGGARPHVLYSGLFLTDDNFLKHVPIPPGWTRYAHHCTVEFRPIGGRFPVGNGLLRIHAIRKTDTVIYAVAEPPPEIRQWTQEQGLIDIPWHVTIATAPGVKPVQAKLAAENNEGNVLETYHPPQTIPFKAGGFTGKEIIQSR